MTTEPADLTGRGSAARLVLGAASIPAALCSLNALPALTRLPALARALPRLSGHGDPGHVALTFDDGPDPDATPAVLQILAAAGVHATFFMLGTMVAQAPDLTRAVAAAGHEVAVHGWDHRSLALRGPAQTVRQLTRARRLIQAVTGQVPRWWRPPYGVLTVAGLAAARYAGLSPVLWSTWGRDWAADATAASVASCVDADLRSGGTVLLHDGRRFSAPGSGAALLEALPALLDGWQLRGLRVGPLSAHRLG